MKILHTSDWHLGQNFMGKSRADEHEAFLFWQNLTLEKQFYSIHPLRNYLSLLVDNIVLARVLRHFLAPL